MKLPTVLQELILEFMWSIVHPTCKLLRDERNDLYETDNLYRYQTFYPAHHFIADTLMYSINFPVIRTYKSSYCCRCGEFIKFGPLEAETGNCMAYCRCSCTGSEDDEFFSVS